MFTFSLFTGIICAVLLPFINCYQYLCTSSGVDYYTYPYHIDWVKTSQMETNYKCFPYSTYYYAKCTNDINNYTIQDFRMNNITYLNYHKKRKFYHLSPRNRLRNIYLPENPGQYRTQIYHPIVDFNVLCIRTPYNKPKSRYKIFNNNDHDESNDQHEQHEQHEQHDERNEYHYDENNEYNEHHDES